MLRIVLLGGTGFVGSAILRKIETAGHRDIQVHALVRGDVKRIGLPFVTAVEGALPDRIPPDLFPPEPHVVVHFATKQIDTDKTGFYAANVEGTRALLDALPPSCCGVIYGSSMSVYGPGEQNGVTEKEPVRPATELAGTRVGAENLVLDATEKSRSSGFVLRPRFILGQGDRYTLKGFRTLADKGLVIGSGKQAYSIIDVDDYAAVILDLARAIMRHSEAGNPASRAFNIGYRKPLGFSRILQTICAQDKRAFPRKRMPVVKPVTALLRALPMTRGLSTQLELVGFSHTGDVGALEREIGTTMTEKDPESVFERIVAQAQVPDSLSGEHLLTLNDNMSPRTVGGKFEKQKTLSENGLPIPPFFCLTAAFYERATANVRNEVNGVLDATDFNDGQSIRNTSGKIAGIYQTLVFSDREKEEILAAFDRLFKPGTLVSVRSSMIGDKLEESEDSLDNPFAGISESFLYVKRDNLFDTIKACWASGFSPEAMTYRHAQDMDLTGFAVAVGIQQMVFGVRSFVMFTCDPNTASKDTVIIAGHGIGEGVVQERVPVDHYFRNYTTGDIRREIAEKTNQLTFDEDTGTGLVEKEVPGFLQTAPCLSDEDIETLSRYGRIIETIFGHPQDIEGTFTEDGSLYVLQSRPVALDYSRQRVWTNANVTESFPGVTTALTYSFSRFFYRHVFYDGYRQMGWSRKLLHDDHAVLDRMIGFLKGRIYYSLTSFYHLHSLNPLFPLFRGYWEKMMGFQSSYQTRPEGMLAQIMDKAVFIAKATRAAGIIFYRFVSHRKGMERFFAWWEDLFGPLRGKTFENEDMLKSVDLYHKVWSEVGNHWGITLTNDTFLPMAYGITEALFKAWKLADDSALLSDLLCGDEEITSVDIILSSVSLAERVNRNPELQSVFLDQDDRAVWSMIEAGRLDQSFCEAVRHHLHRYGDRGLQELKMEQPNMRHAPWELIRMVQGYARSGVTVSSLKAKEKEVRASAEKRLKKALRFRPFRRFVLNRMLSTVRTLIRNRENSRYCRSEVFGFTKNIFRGIGEQLAEKKILDTPEDIFHLSVDDIFGYIDGTGVTEDLRALSALRKKEYQANKEVETAVQITTLGPVRNNALETVDAPDDDPGVLKGLGSSTGKVRGTARVVIDPTCPPENTKDMILVARETDPGWLFLMLASKGLVVERGSMLSHTAITGRKFGIPTIVSLPGATTKIPDGAPIEIDGASGIVTLLSN